MEVYDKLYLLVTATILYLMYYFYTKHRDTREEDMKVFCEKCNEEQSFLLETKEGDFKYTCPKCKHKGLVKNTPES